jgi:hypothetical protein
MPTRPGSRWPPSPATCCAAGALASLTYAKARGATLRRDLIDVAARIARHGRGHITLHLPEAWHYEAEWMNCHRIGPDGAADLDLRFGRAGTDPAIQGSDDAGPDGQDRNEASDLVAGAPRVCGTASYLGLYSRPK